MTIAKHLGGLAAGAALVLAAAGPAAADYVDGLGLVQWTPFGAPVVPLV